MDLSAMVTRIRTKRGWSQRELAYRLGVHKRSVIRWEKQSGFLPKPETMKKLRRLE
jgi:transcriptional regulator with XRE-family HTH domain